MNKLTHQEENIMIRVWQLKECAVKEIQDSLEDPKPPYTTVASIVRNLENKGYLNTRKFGNVNVYSPKIKEDEYKMKFMSNVVKLFFDDSYKELVTFFAKDKKINPDELAEIIKIIEKRK